MFRGKVDNKRAICHIGKKKDMRTKVYTNIVGQSIPLRSLRA